MESNDHLSLLGAGPIYVLSISVVTLAALILHYSECIPRASWPGPFLLICRGLGILGILAGIVLWIEAVFASKIRQHIRRNSLVTDGVYGIVRHPVYSAFTLLEWGLLLFTANLWLFILIPIYWIYFTVLIKGTEEKWLFRLYGNEYEEYCRRVNRCIPWFPKRRSMGSSPDRHKTKNESN